MPLQQECQPVIPAKLASIVYQSFLPMPHKTPRIAQLATIALQVRFCLIKLKAPELHVIHWKTGNVFRPGLEKQKIGNWSSHFGQYLELAVIFSPIYGVCQSEILVFFITIKEFFLNAIYKRRCYFIINIMNDIPTLLTLPELTCTEVMIINRNITQYYQIYTI